MVLLISEVLMGTGSWDIWVVVGVGPTGWKDIDHPRHQHWAAFPSWEQTTGLHYVWKHLFTGAKTDASTLTKTDICTNSNMLKTHIAEPTLLITKKNPEPSATEAKYYSMGGIILLIQVMFSTRLLWQVMTDWNSCPFHSFWSEPLEHIQCPLYI